jgi:hypothetical protein
MKVRFCLAAVAFTSFLSFSLSLAQVAPVAQIGVFRPATGQWFLDFSGNRAWNRCGPDGCLVQFGSAGDRPVIGDWSGDGVPRIGVFRPATGQWFLDRNGNGFWDGCGLDRCINQFGASIDRPVVGDWTGTGTVRVGVFRPATGQWFLDLNDNGLWDGCSTDRCLDQFGSAADLPVAGDIDADGLPEVGVYRPSTGQWFFDRNNNGLWDGCATEMCLTQFGAAFDLPVMADMNGDGAPEVGVFRPATGQWFFDLDRSGSWSGCAADGCFGPFGATVDLPVTGAWDPMAGPGDPQNYFPLTQGSTGTFQGTSSEDGVFTGIYQNTVTVSGTRVIDGVTITVVSMTNPGNTGSIEEYLLKDGRGITNWGNNDPFDTITPLLVAYQEVLFPMWTGAKFVQYQRSNLDFGEDLDGDGINERVAISSEVSVASFENVTVPAGGFSNCARVVNTLKLFGGLSGIPGLTFSGTVTTTTWYAPGTGPVKVEVALMLTTSDGQSFSTKDTEELTSYFVAAPPLPQITQGVTQ